MPTYEYKCLKCKKHFDCLQKMSDKALTKCIHCKGKVERLISGGTGLIFKGTGFYITDYKNKGKKGSDKNDKPESKPKPASPASPAKPS